MPSQSFISEIVRLCTKRGLVVDMIITPKFITMLTTTHYQTLISVIATVVQSRAPKTTICRGSFSMPILMA